MTTCVIMFAKEPVPGSVKTRLHIHLSPTEAAQLYSAFVVDTADTLAQTSAQRKIVAYTPASGLEPIRHLLGPLSAEFEYLPQADADLGGRMGELFKKCFDEGAERVVVVGSDSPSLPSSIVDEALSLLQRHPLVLGPSVDGGYYLLGQRSSNERLFKDVDWSTGRVLEQTLDKVPGESIGLLPPWYDVDSPAEAAFLKVHLRAIKQAGGCQGERSLMALNQLRLPAPS